MYIKTKILCLEYKFQDCYKIMPNLDRIAPTPNGIQMSEPGRFIIQIYTILPIVFIDAFKLPILITLS